MATNPFTIQVNSEQLKKLQGAFERLILNLSEDANPPLTEKTLNYLQRTWTNIEEPTQKAFKNWIKTQPDRDKKARLEFYFSIMDEDGGEYIPVDKEDNPEDYLELAITLEEQSRKLLKLTQKIEALDKEKIIAKTEAETALGKLNQSETEQAQLLQEKMRLEHQLKEAQEGKIHELRLAEEREEKHHTAQSALVITLEERSKRLLELTRKIEELDRENTAAKIEAETALVKLSQSETEQARLLQEKVALEHQLKEVQEGKIQELRLAREREDKLRDEALESKAREERLIRELQEKETARLQEEKARRFAEQEAVESHKREEEARRAAQIEREAKERAEAAAKQTQRDASKKSKEKANKSAGFM